MGFLFDSVIWNGNHKWDDVLNDKLMYLQTSQHDCILHSDYKKHSLDPLLLRLYFHHLFLPNYTSYNSMLFIMCYIPNSGVGVGNIIYSITLCRTVQYLQSMCFGCSFPNRRFRNWFKIQFWKSTRSLNLHSDFPIPRRLIQSDLNCDFPICERRPPNYFSYIQDFIASKSRSKSNLNMEICIFLFFPCISSTRFKRCVYP